MLSMELSGAPRQLGGGGGESIFQLGIYKIDGTYWLALVGMILFCTLIDRGQALLNYFAEGSPANKVFLEKVYTELLLFGAVAVTLFVLLQAASGISDNTVTMITFIDVQVSMGACSLIFIAGVTSILQKVYWHHWCSCEMAHATAEQETAAKSAVLPSCSKILDAMAATKSISHVEMHAEHIFASFYCATTPETYSLMTAQFRKEHQVPKVFRYHFYLYAVMTRVCCNLMSIEWSSWLILAFAGALGFILDLIIVESGDGERTFTGYIIAMLLIDWSLLLAHLVLYLVVRLSFKKLIFHLARGSAEGPVKVPIGDRWPDRAAWALQIIHLFNSFCLAFYIMHGIPNLKSESPLWTLAVLAPLLCNVFFLLPLTLPRLVCIDGFLAVDPDALELVFEELQQSEIDMRYLYDLWTLARTPSVLGWKSSLNMVEFQKYLASLGLHLTGPRLKRLFRLMDSDLSGTVEMSELQEHLDAMREHFEASSERNSRNTGLDDKKDAVRDTTQAEASVPSESIAKKVEHTTL